MYCDVNSGNMGCYETAKWFYFLVHVIWLAEIEIRVLQIYFVFPFWSLE